MSETPRPLRQWPHATSPAAAGPRRRRRAAVFATLATAFLSAAPLPARPAEPAPGEPAKPAAPAPLALGAVTVTPANPAADTLCQLRVEVTNRGDRIASQLGFTVKVNGKELPVYRNQLFMQRLDPGKTATVRLYNFWTTESGRAAPADGKYRVEVTLAGAQWYTIAADAAGVEVWTPQGPVPGLPIGAVATAGK